jgi:putative ABC transport system permease protein
MLVRASALTARRRTAATAAPILLTVGLSLSLLGASGSLNAARDASLRGSAGTEYALVPDGTPGLGRAVVDRVAAIAGVHIAAPVPTTIYTADDGRLQVDDALAVDPAALTAAFRLDVVAGSLDAFGDGAVVVPDAWGIDAGRPLEIRLADGSAASLTVVAVYHALRGQDVAYLPPRYAATGAYARDGLARRAYVWLSPGTDRPAALAAIRAAVAGAGATLVTREQLVSSESAFARHLAAVRQRSVAGIVVLFCLIAIVNTLVMATADRRRDLTLLRLGGATRRQVLTVFAAEALLVSGVGVVLALLATAVNLAGLWVALGRLFGTAPLVVPWATVGAIAGVAVLLAVLGTVLPTAAALRPPRRGRASP